MNKDLKKGDVVYATGFPHVLGLVADIEISGDSPSAEVLWPKRRTMDVCPVAILEKFSDLLKR